MKFTGENKCTIPAPIEAVWSEALSLQWLVAPDAVRLDAAPSKGSTFAFLMDGRTIAGSFTSVEPDRGLEWQAVDGSSGSLRLNTCPEGIMAHCVLVSVPTATVDKLAAGAFSLFARKKAQQLTNDDVAKDLRALSARARRRAAGEVLTSTAPQMLGVVDFGEGSWEPDTVPAFDQGGQLVLAPGEHVMLSAMAAAVGAESAEAAGGKEQFTALWPLQRHVRVTLTSERVVYQMTDLGSGDPTWLIMGGATGLALTAGSYLRAAHARKDKAVAGQVFHRYATNVIAGDGHRFGFSDWKRASATLLVSPKTIVRVHLLFEQDSSFTREWVSTIAAERLRDKPPVADDRWTQLESQRVQPSAVDGYWGPLYALPHWCAVGSHRAMVG
jgi:hypothetical protein